VAEGILRTGAAETSRVEAFSDGVLAIVITLLVLNIKIPDQLAPGDAALWQALAQQLPMLGAWALSFFFVLVFWVAHHYFFRQLAHIDRGLLWLNGLFLFAISFTPFPTALLGLYPGRSASATMLSVAMFATAGSFSIMRWYATRHARLFRPEHVRYVLVEHPRHFSNRGVLQGNSEDNNTSEGLLTIDGEKHRQQRRAALSPPHAEGQERRQQGDRDHGKAVVGAGADGSDRGARALDTYLEQGGELRHQQQQRAQQPPGKDPRRDRSAAGGGR